MPLCVREVRDQGVARLGGRLHTSGAIRRRRGGRRGAAAVLRAQHSEALANVSDAGTTRSDPATSQNCASWTTTIRVWWGQGHQPFRKRRILKAEAAPDSEFHHTVVTLASHRRAFFHNLLWSCLLLPDQHSRSGRCQDSTADVLARTVLPWACSTMSWVPTHRRSNDHSDAPRRCRLRHSAKWPQLCSAVRMVRNGMPCTTWPHVCHGTLRSMYVAQEQRNEVQGWLARHTSSTSGGLWAWQSLATPCCNLRHAAAFGDDRRYLPECPSLREEVQLRLAPSLHRQERGLGVCPEAGAEVLDNHHLGEQGSKGGLCGASLPGTIARSHGDTLDRLDTGGAGIGRATCLRWMRGSD